MIWPSYRRGPGLVRPCMWKRHIRKNIKSQINEFKKIEWFQIEKKCQLKKERSQKKRINTPSIRLTNITSFWFLDFSTWRKTSVWPLNDWNGFELTKICCYNFFAFRSHEVIQNKNTWYCLEIVSKSFRSNRDFDSFFSSLF